MRPTFEPPLRVIADDSLRNELSPPLRATSSACSSRRLVSRRRPRRPSRTSRPSSTTSGPTTEMPSRELTRGLLRSRGTSPGAIWPSLFCWSCCLGLTRWDGKDGEEEPSWDVERRSQFPRKDVHVRRCRLTRLVSRPVDCLVLSPARPSPTSSSRPSSLSSSVSVPSPSSANTWTSCRSPSQQASSVSASCVVKPVQSLPFSLSSTSFGTADPWSDSCGS